MCDDVAAWLSEHRSTDDAQSRAAKQELEQLIKQDQLDTQRACALVYASLAPPIQREAASASLTDCAHCIMA
jgi:hypothetical protein